MPNGKTPGSRSQFVCVCKSVQQTTSRDTIFRSSWNISTVNEFKQVVHISGVHKYICILLNSKSKNGGNLG